MLSKWPALFLWSLITLWSCIQGLCNYRKKNRGPHWVLQYRMPNETTLCYMADFRIPQHVWGWWSQAVQWVMPLRWDKKDYKCPWPVATPTGSLPACPDQVMWHKMASIRQILAKDSEVPIESPETNILRQYLASRFVEPAHITTPSLEYRKWLKPSEWVQQGSYNISLTVIILLSRLNV